MPKYNNIRVTVDANQFKNNLHSLTGQIGHAMKSHGVSSTEVDKFYQEVRQSTSVLDTIKEWIVLKVK